MFPENLSFWAFSVCVLITVIATVFGCICGCRKTVPKQNNTQANATRSLPDLPVESDRVHSQNAETLWEAVEGNGDTSSDLYATVEDNKTESGRNTEKKTNLPRMLTVDSSYGSPSQTDDSLSPYARVKGEHPYDQLKKNEHPYAQVGANGKAGPSHLQNGKLQSSRSSMGEGVDLVDSPVAPPRTRKSISLSQSSLASASALATNDNILAATAIAGGIPANQELPYMTPPLPTNQQTQHFSGDSQDSSKGYTSISVREPLASIMGQVPRRQELIDSHYATVSDDSDEMYAAIDEPSQSVYTSGSETYAQIQPLSNVAATQSIVLVENHLPHHSHHTHGLSNAKNVHSRQESSSSAASSLVSPNSPKPEKRQANSPLPRPPDPGNPALDEMYAKVFKKRRSSQSVSSLDLETSECLRAVNSVVPGYETVEGGHSAYLSNTDMSIHCDEMIPNYETVSGNGSDLDRLGPGYETVSGGHDSLVPGYERVLGGRDVNSDSEPNYEELRPQGGDGMCSESNYATVNKKKKSDSYKTEPDYASLSRKDLGYETVDGYEPNYESVCRLEPNYESVERQEPDYEKVCSNSNQDYEPISQENSSYGGYNEDVYSQVHKPRTGPR